MQLRLDLIKYHCKKCGYEEKPTRLEAIAGLISTIIMNTLAGIGIAAIFLFFLIGPDFMLTKMVESAYNEMNIEEADKIRELTLRLTRICSGDDSACYSLELYNNLKDKIRYVPNSYHRAIYSPLYTYYNGGDCDNLANMYVSMLKTVGIEAKMSCSLNYQHCLAIVPYISKGEKHNTKFIVDLANDFYVMVDENEDEWKVVSSLA